MSTYVLTVNGSAFVARYGGGQLTSHTSEARQWKTLRGARKYARTAWECGNLRERGLVVVVARLEGRTLLVEG